MHAGGGIAHAVLLCNRFPIMKVFYNVIFVFLAGYWCSGLLHTTLYPIPWCGGSYGQTPPPSCRQPRCYAGQNNVRTRRQHTYVELN